MFLIPNTIVPNEDKKVDDNSVNYKASDVSHSDLNDDLFVLSGDAEISSGGYTINADRIVFNTKTNILHSHLERNKFLKNNNRIKITTKNGDELFCSSIKFDVNQNIGIAKNALLYKNGAIILAKSAKIDYDGTFYCTDVSLTSCKKEDPDWAVIVDKAVVFKQKLFYLYGAKLMFSGIYFPFIPNVSFPYLFTETKKSGLKYPESIRFANDGGLAIKNFGFYLYFSRYRDLNCNLSFFLGNGSFTLAFIHNYLMPSSYSGNVTFSLDKISLHSLAYDYEEVFSTKWELSWKHSTLGSKNYKFSSDVLISNSYGDEDDKDKDQKKDLKADILFNAKDLLKYLSTDIIVKYDRSFSSKLESFELPHLKLYSNNITFLKNFSVHPNFEFICFASNKKKHVFLRDEHDIVLKDDILGDEFLLNKANIYGFFRHISGQKIKNILKKFSVESMYDVPVKFDNSLFNFGVKYTGKIFMLKYNPQTDKVEFRRVPYYVHMAEIDGGVKLKLRSKPLLCDEFSRGNLLKITNITYCKNVVLGVNLHPSSDMMQSIFGLSKAYRVVGDETVDLFYHSYFKNVDKSESFKLTFAFENYFNSKMKSGNNDVNVKIFSFSVNTAYDFLAEKCKLSDMKFGAKLDIWKIKSDFNLVIFPYQYSAPGPDKKRKKVDEWFFSNKTKTFKEALKESIMQCTFDDRIDIINNTSNWNDKSSSEDSESFDDGFNKKYDRFYIWDNLKWDIRYLYEYKYNPVVSVSDTRKILSSTLSTSLSSKCDISCEASLNLVDKYVDQLSISGDYNLHCWRIDFKLSLDVDQDKERKINYSVSISPKESAFSFLSQNRGSDLDILS